MFAALKAIAQTSGKGAVDKRIGFLAEVLKQVNGVSAKYIVRMLLGTLRLGIGDATLLDALATAAFHTTAQRSVLERAYHQTSDLGHIARTLWQHANMEEAKQAVEHLQVQVGKPICPELAERLPDAGTIIQKMGVVDVQEKYDGVRVQIHKNGQQVFLFSRNQENLSAMFPEIVEGIRRQIQADTAILDAEALAYHPASEEFLPFQETARRRRKYRIEALAEQLPLKAFVFDLLYKDGASLLEKPLAERLALLEATLAPDESLLLVRHQVVQDAQTLSLRFEEATSKGLEGVMAKRL